MSNHLSDELTGRTGLRARIADPRLISWPTVAVSSLLLSYEIWSHGLLDFIGAQVMVFALLFVARVLYLRRSYPTRHAWVMIGTIVLASFFGTVLAQLAFSQPNTLVTADGAFTRMFVIPVSGLLSLSLIDYRNNVRDLRATAMQLEATRDEGLRTLSDARQDIINRVRGKLEGAVWDLGGDADRQSAPKLASLAQETVRPLSHELARTTPDFSPTTVTPPRVRWSSVLTQVAARPLIVPWLMASAVALMSIRFTFGQSDTAVGSTLVDFGSVSVSMDAPAVVASLGFLIVVFCAVWLLSGGAVRLTRSMLMRASGGARWLVVAASVVGIGAGLQIVLVALPILPGPLSSIETDPVGRFWAFAPVVLIALVLAIARTVSLARASVIEDLMSVTRELEWEVARIRLDLWAQQRCFAQAIHGPLQAAITASALLLTESSDSDARGAVSAAHDRIKIALDRLTEPSDSVADWAIAVAEIERTWQGVCEVSVRVEPDARSVLDRDDPCRQAAVMVVGESVANAAVHGRATRTDIEATLRDDRFIELTITDNGNGFDPAARTGFGSTLLDEACSRWSLTRTDDVTRLVAVLASTASSDQVLAAR